MKKVSKKEAIGKIIQENDLQNLQNEFEALYKDKEKNMVISLKMISRKLSINAKIFML